jgi:hypothetical protein
MFAVPCCDYYCCYEYYYLLRLPNFRCGASAAPTPQVRLSAMLLLLIVGSSELGLHAWSDLQWHDAHIKFHPNPSIGSRVDAYGQTLLPYIRYFYYRLVNNA